MYGAVDARTLPWFCCRRVCYSVKTTLGWGGRKWHTFCCEFQATSYHPWRDLDFFARYPTSLHIFFDVYTSKRVKWSTSCRFSGHRNHDIVDHSCSTCPGTFGTEKFLCTTTVSWILLPNARRIVHFIVLSPFQTFMWSAHVFRKQTTVLVALPPTTLIWNHFTTLDFLLNKGSGSRIKTGIQSQNEFFAPDLGTWHDER